MTAAEQLTTLLGLRTAPVALSFQDAPPATVARVAAAGPSGCTYWKWAAEGQTFSTEAADHYSCPIGAYTHGVDLPPAHAKELEAVVGTMIQVGYLRPEEVPGIPRRPDAFRVAVYAPLAAAPAEVDVVLVRGNAKQMMLLAEAALAAGVGAEAPLMGRPTCAAVPEVLRTGHSAASLGCIGNRVYTGMADDELWLALPGKDVGAVVAKLAIIVNANRELETYHRAKASQACAHADGTSSSGG
jgi:uncharacterized protein (DUF169 family)